MSAVSGAFGSWDGVTLVYILPCSRWRDVAGALHGVDQVASDWVYGCVYEAKTEPLALSFTVDRHLDYRLDGSLGIWKVVSFELGWPVSAEEFREWTRLSRTDFSDARVFNVETGETQFVEEAFVTRVPLTTP